MALHHVLYRCPVCGHDPTRGAGDEADCPACGASFRRATRSTVEVREGDRVRRASVADLVDAVRAGGGPRGEAADNGVLLASSALFLGQVSEEPVSRKGRLLGWVERPGPPEAGTLEVDTERLRFRPRAGPPLEWPLLELTALQVSTSSLQLGIRGEGTVQVTLPDASSFRWEELIQELLRDAWLRDGRGTITEFQPRITDR